MNRSEAKKKAKIYLKEAQECLKYLHVSEIKDTCTRPIKNKRSKKSCENEFNINFIKSYIETKLNNPNN